MDLTLAYKKLLTSASRDLRPDDTADVRGRDICSLLEKRFDTAIVLPMGSLPNGTAIAGSDLDLLIELAYHHVYKKNPESILGEMRDYLARYYNCEVDGQVVKVTFPTFPKVDVVPAFSYEESRSYFYIPDLKANRWIIADPVAHMATMRKLSSLRKKLIRLLKVWNSRNSPRLLSYDLDRVGITAQLEENAPFPNCVQAMFGHAWERLSTAPRVGSQSESITAASQDGSLKKDIVEAVFGYRPLLASELGTSISGEERLLLCESLASAKSHLNRSLQCWRAKAHTEALEEARCVFGNCFPSLG